MMGAQNKDMDFVPNELRENEIDRADWDDYINAENALFMEVHNNVVMKQTDQDTTSLNRYKCRIDSSLWEGCPEIPGLTGYNDLNSLYPDRFAS